MTNTISIGNTIIGINNPATFKVLGNIVITSNHLLATVQCIKGSKLTKKDKIIHRFYLIYNNTILFKLIN
jgi:hypothetical protein